MYIYIYIYVYTILRISEIGIALILCDTIQLHCMIQNSDSLFLGRNPTYMVAGPERLWGVMLRDKARGVLIIMTIAMVIVIIIIIIAIVIISVIVIVIITVIVIVKILLVIIILILVIVIVTMIVVW